jgi:hypothetical protein
MRVEPGSPADLAGIAAGGVIAGVGSVAVGDVREATRAIRQAQHEGPPSCCGCSPMVELLSLRSNCCCRANADVIGRLTCVNADLSARR